MSSGLTSFSQTLQTKSLPDLSKQLNKLQQQAKELPKRLGSLQQEFETERASFLLNKQKQENVVSSQAKGAGNTFTSCVILYLTHNCSTCCSMDWIQRIRKANEGSYYGNIQGITNSHELINSKSYLK